MKIKHHLICFHLNYQKSTRSYFIKSDKIDSRYSVVFRMKWPSSFCFNFACVVLLSGMISSCYYTAYVAIFLCSGTVSAVVGIFCISEDFRVLVLCNAFAQRFCFVFSLNIFVFRSRNSN